MKWDYGVGYQLAFVPFGGGGGGGLTGVEGPVSGISESSACIVSTGGFDVDMITVVTWTGVKMPAVDGAIRMGIESSMG
jgi:hypothetical protein